MNKKFLYLLGILITILLGTYFYWKFCCCACGAKNGNSIEKVDENNAVKVAWYNPFSVKSKEGDLSLTTPSNFDFIKSGLNFKQPVSPVLDQEILKMKGYLVAKEDKSVSITGYYKGNETNTSAFSNLGLARANSVKNYLVKKGVPSKLIDTKGALNDAMVADSLNIFHGPISFDVVNFKEDTTEIDDLLKDIKKAPLVLYFKTGQQSIELTVNQREKVAIISKYLDKVEGSFCLVIGHTDNVGKVQSNIALGQKRADFAKQYLVNNAIAENKIKAISKGPNAPIADNSTKQGQAKNRRIEITIE